MAQLAFRIAVVAIAVCGMSLAQQHYGTIYGDVIEAPFVQSLSPLEGPKQGGTMITVQGVGFQNDERLSCRFTRLNPNTEMQVVKDRPGKYVSPTEIVCEAPEWEEDDCPNCIVRQLSGQFFGHTGSRYLRYDGSTGDKPTEEIGVGDYIRLSAAQVGANEKQTSLTQFYEVTAIEACSGSGCFCDGHWEEKQYQVSVRYNGSGYEDSAANRGFEIVEATNDNCALYRYDKLTGGAANAWSPVPKDMHRDYNGATCTPRCCSDSTCNADGNWRAGTKITLSEPVYKIDGRPNVARSGQIGHRASKFSCTGCKCAGGCQTTVTVTNDGKKFSGAGLGGQVWSGSGAAFALKDKVPTVTHIDNGLPGYRDSTRIFGPPSGGTTITVHGSNFQDSPLLRCYFETVRVLVKAEYLSDTMVRCKTPAFFSRQLDDSMELSNQDGSARHPHTKVMVTNDGMLGVNETEGEFFGHLSQNPYLMDDGSNAYIWTFDHANTYTSGQTGFESNNFRSTCQAGLYPNEGMAPCWDSHSNTVTNPIACDGDMYDRDCDGTSLVNGRVLSTSPTYSAGNDVLFKYATCYDANPAGPVDSMNLYGAKAPNTGSTVGGKKINSTSTLGQTILVGTSGSLQFGPLTYIELHLEKPTDADAVIEVSIGAGGFPDAPTANQGMKLCNETIIVSKITPGQTDYKYPVFFSKPQYLLPGTPYYLQLKHISGAEDVVWKYTDASTTGAYYAHLHHALSYQFKVMGYTCDGCREKYIFNPASPSNTLSFGAWNGTQDTGIYTGDTDQQGGSTTLHYQTVTDRNNLGSLTARDSTYRSMLSQEFRPTESGTITHAQIKLNNKVMDENNDGSADNRVEQAFVSIWVTQYGKYGEYVCSEFGGTLEALYYGAATGAGAGASTSGNWGAAGANDQAAMAASLKVCDSDFDGNFNDDCALGTVCDPNNGHINGGCGYRGKCTLAETVTHGHRLRPESGGQYGNCGTSSTCAITESLRPDHMKLVQTGGTASWVEFEFATPINVEKHTTYFLNAAVVGNPDISTEVIWQAGAAYGDGGARRRQNAADLDQNGDGTPDGDANPVSDELRASYTRDAINWHWSKNHNLTLATKLTRCVSSTAQVLGFTTSGEKTGCCSARVSPQGGDKGAMVTITGRNFFPSDDLRCIFRNEDGSTAAIVPGEVLDASYTVMQCRAPTMDPHSSRDCTNPALCQGTVLQVTNDLRTVGPQYMGPKWRDTNPNDDLDQWNTATAGGVLAYLGQQPLKILFSDIYVSPTGSDTVGDGTIARPYQTIQRGVDAANEYDQLILKEGYYTGLGNRGLRHHGKKIQMKAYMGDRQNTIIDCQHAPDGFILNNNKDSDSPFAGHIDTQDIITKNCENLRIYDI